jgi:hypothetical protein
MFHCAHSNTGFWLSHDEAVKPEQPFKKVSRRFLQQAMAATVD